MFDGVILRINIWRLQRQKRNRLRQYHVECLKIRRINQAAANRRRELLEDLSSDLGNIDGEIWQLISSDLVDRSQRYQLPLPESVDWSETGGLAYRHLTPEAIARVRTEIRIEQKERWSTRLLWLPLLTSLTGALGTMIGLIAIFKN